MTATFLDRNKKKSLLAALLLFLRQRRLAVLLVLLVLLASTIFLGPSTWGLPGGERFVAGMAWIAGKMGIDASKWGLKSDSRRPYADLLALFRAARSETSGSLGWGALFGRGAAGKSSNSLDFVKGSKADLAHGIGAGAGPGAQTVAGIVDPSDAKGRSDGTVAISQADMGGEREGLVREAFAGGFMNGLLGGSGDAALSGGAYAGKGFFGGVGGAASPPNGLAAAGLAGVASVGSPASTRGGKATGTLSSMSSKLIAVKASKGIAGASALGGNNYTQLAEGASRDQLATTYCQPPACANEYATTQSGAIYDGNNISAGILTSSDPGGVGAGLINSTVDVPPDDAGGSAGDAQNMSTCASLVQQCAQSKTAPMNQEGVDENILTGYYNQMGSACGNPCNCGPCNDLNNKINNLCNGDMATQVALANAPCAPLPDYCGSLGFSSPASTMQGNGQNLCAKNMGKCSCGFFCGLMCLF